MLRRINLTIDEESLPSCCSGEYKALKSWIEGINSTELKIEKMNIPFTGGYCNDNWKLIISRASFFFCKRVLDRITFPTRIKLK